LLEASASGVNLDPDPRKIDDGLWNRTEVDACI
jgi:hypothetical protein